MGTRGIVAGDGQLSRGEQMGTEKASYAADHRLEHLYLAVDIKSSRSETLSTPSRTSVAVLSNQSGHAVLEVA